MIMPTTIAAMVADADPASSPPRSRSRSGPHCSKVISTLVSRISVSTAHQTSVGRRGASARDSMSVPTLKASTVRPRSTSSAIATTTSRSRPRRQPRIVVAATPTARMPMSDALEATRLASASEASAAAPCRASR